jgi:hypothetical protein
MAVEQSLRRLQTEWIDLYQIHRPDHSTDIEETLSVLSDLVSQGKIRAFGCSTFPPEDIVEAHWIAERRALKRFRTEQSPYSLLARAPIQRRDGFGPEHLRGRGTGSAAVRCGRFTRAARGWPGSSLVTAAQTTLPRWNSPDSFTGAGSKRFSWTSILSTGYRPDETGRRSSTPSFDVLMR